MLLSDPHDPTVGAVISIPSHFWLISVRKASVYIQHDGQHWGCRDLSDLPGKCKPLEPPRHPPHSSQDGMEPWDPLSRTRDPWCHQALHQWVESREPERQKFTSFAKLLVEGDLSQEPVCSRNKSPFKAGKSQAESVRYPNVALS